MKGRLFCFTDYELNKTKLEEIYDKEQQCVYLFAGEETCPKTKRIHWQGFVYFKNPRELQSIIKLFAPRHIEQCRGSLRDNEIYCSKEGHPVIELGVKPEAGKRNDLIDIDTMIKEQKSEREIFEEHPMTYIRYNKGIQKAINLYNKKRDWVMDVRIYWGRSGTGKTKTVWEEFGIDNVYPKMVGKWWDNYKGEACVLIDDFDPQNCFDITFDFYLKLLDRYPMSLEYKGGSCQFTSKTIIFTSNYNPKRWFRNKKNRTAFFRRISLIRHFHREKSGTEVTG